MTLAEQKATLKDFVKRWKGRGYEKGDTQQFWLQLLGSLGYAHVDSVLFEQRVKSGGFIDVWVRESDVMIEQKALNVDLDKPEPRQGELKTPLKQVLDYAEAVPLPEQPKYVVTCNFQEFRIYDRSKFGKSELEENVFSFSLEDIPDHPDWFNFIVDPANSRLEKEKQVSIKAGEKIGVLYDLLREGYIDPDSEESMHALNVLCVRLVFCLYCEDAGLFAKDSFLNYLKDTTPSDVRLKLKGLFQALDKEKADRDPYDQVLKAFPYVNGGLFADDIEIPNFNQAALDFLINEVSAPIDWSQISPTIFGGIFESTLNPETRRSGGMHYTSPENIHKVIDPLFLNDLKEEFRSIRDSEELTPRQQQNRYKKFHQKLCSLTFFDPACGSGNFLTETYLCLRKLEDAVLSEIRKAGNIGQIEMTGMQDEEEGTRLSLTQFHGIEINDFAVAVAETALYIARLKANNDTMMLLDVDSGDLPLKESAHIVLGNALRLDWNEVVPAELCNYIMGNPPFLGHISRSSEQTQELIDVWNRKDIGRLDYVTGWYKKAVDYLKDNEKAEWAFVSTNSITMGEPVPVLFKCLSESGWIIKFAHKTFVWNSEASVQAHVHVVIIGFTRKTVQPVLYSCCSKEDVPTKSFPTHINGYLLDAPDVFVGQRKKPLFPILNTVTMGNMPRGTGLIIESDEVQVFLDDPVAKKYVRRFVMGRELINNLDRYCLWMVNCEEGDINKSQILSERIKSVKEFRLTSKAKSTREMANTPWLFGQRAFTPSGTYLGIPKVFSVNRKYATCDLLTPDVIPGDKVYVCDDPDGLQFAIISSFFFICWQKAIGGRLKSDCSFSNTVVWNNFPVPSFSDEEKDALITAGKSIIAARKKHEDVSLATLYDPGKMPDDLLAAHQALDRAVEEAYGVDFNGDEEKIVAHLFKLYEEATKSESDVPKKTQPVESKQPLKVKIKLKK